MNTVPQAAAATANPDEVFAAEARPLLADLVQAIDARRAADLAAAEAAGGLNAALLRLQVLIEEMAKVEPGEEPPPPPPPPPPGKGDPVSGLLWPSGFGQAAGQLKALEGLRGRKAGAFAGWTDYANVGTNWGAIRGGSLGKFDQRQGIFAVSGAHNFHTAVQKKLLDPRAVLVWIVPMVPHSDSNAAKFSQLEDRPKVFVDWNHPNIWKTFLEGRRDEFVANWKDFGARLGSYHQQHGIDSAKFVLVIGHEWTGWWYPWSCGPDLPNFLRVQRLMVDSVREGLKITLPQGWMDVRFESRVAGESKFVPWKATDGFAGKEHFRVLGCSLHGANSSLGTPQGWMEELKGTTSKVGLEVARQMAVDAGVKLGIDEWGVVRGLPGQPPDKKHPPDSHPEQAMLNVFDYLKTNAADIAHECFLYSARQYDLLAGAKDGWGGAKGYLKGVRRSLAA